MDTLTFDEQFAVGFHRLFLGTYCFDILIVLILRKRNEHRSQSSQTDPPYRFHDVVFSMLYPPRRGSDRLEQ